MRTLEAGEVVQIWEWGADKHPLDRGLILIEACFGDALEAPAADLPVGRRDALLIDVREAIAGSVIEMTVACPQCQVALEFALTAQALRVDTASTDPGRRFEHAFEGGTVEFRLPTTADQLALRDVTDPSEARRHLRARILTRATRDGERIEADALPEAVWLQIEQTVAELDVQADLRLAVHCNECGHDWAAAFDPTPFVWEELSLQVRMLSREVTQLATRFGWSEAEILAMNPQRRRWYLEQSG